MKSISRVTYYDRLLKVEKEIILTTKKLLRACNGFEPLLMIAPEDTARTINEFSQKNSDKEINFLEKLKKFLIENGILLKSIQTPSEMVSAIEKVKFYPNEKRFCLIKKHFELLNKKLNLIEELIQRDKEKYFDLREEFKHEWINTLNDYSSRGDIILEIENVDKMIEQSKNKKAVISKSKTQLSKFKKTVKDILSGK